MRLAVQILFSLRDAVELQRAVFQGLWRCACDRWRGNQVQLVDVILQTFNRDAFEEEGCRAFCTLLLRHILRQQAANKAPLHMNSWLDQADMQEHASFVEVILRFAIAFSSDTSLAAEGIPGGVRWSSHCPLAPLEDAWGIATRADEPVRAVQALSLLQYPEFWQRAISIAGRREQQLTAGIMVPVRNGLTFLALKVEEQELTVQEMLRGPSAAAWENPVLVELLEGARRAAAVPKLGPQLKKMTKKVQFMRSFENAIEHLRNLFPMRPQPAKALASALHRSFLEATTDQDFEDSPPLGQLEVALAQIDESAWHRPVNLPAPVQPSLVDVAAPSFCSWLTAIETLHLARSGQHRPLQSMLGEAERQMNGKGVSSGKENNLADLLFSLYEQLKTILSQLAGLLDEEAGLQPEVLGSLQMYWAEVSPAMVLPLLEEIKGVTSPFCLDEEVEGETSLLPGNLHVLGRRLEATLRSRQTVEFWKLCNTIMGGLSSASAARQIAAGFSEETQRRIAALQAMHEALQDAKSKKAKNKLPARVLDEVGLVREQLSELFGFLDSGGQGFDLVVRLVTTMAEVPGVSLFRVLLSSVQKGEHLAMRLAELVEGALTQDTLANVEQASAVFLPLCASALAALDFRVDPNKFGMMVESTWSPEVQREALRARSQAQIGELVLNMLREAHRVHGSRICDFFDGLRSALRQGQVVQQKLEESSDDATAVSNTVHGMVTAGQLVLTQSPDGLHFEVTGVFLFNKNQEIRRDVQQLTECSDKASLAVPKGIADVDNPTALTQEKVRLFTGFIEGILGLRQALSELLQVGHPYLEDIQSLRFPSRGEGLSAPTLQDLREKLRWAQDAVQHWCSAMDQARSKHAIMSCIPARNITKVARAMLNNEPDRVASLISLQLQSKDSFEADPILQEAFLQCKFDSPREGAHQCFLEKLVEALAVQAIPEHALTRFSPLHEVARNYRKARAPDDATIKSRMERRQNPKFYPKRILLVQEEASHEAGNASLKSTAATAVLSLLLPLGIGPSPENLLLCDASTTKDDVLRFLHRVTHATRMAANASCQAQVLGVLVHVDCLHFDVLQELLRRVDGMQAAVGRRKDADSTPEVEVRLAFTLTCRAPKTLIEGLEKDLCKQQQINVLKLSSIKAFLQNAEPALGYHRIVTSDFAGDGKTHAIKESPMWDQDSSAMIVWGGAQTRGQAARALKKAAGKASVHLELHSFEEGGGVNADMLLLELLLLRCVFDPERSEWTRLELNTPIFVEVANSIKVRDGGCTDQLLMLCAPILEAMPGQQKVDAQEEFRFSANDLDPFSASPVARDFALAGAALLLGDDQRRLVGDADRRGVVFKLAADAQGQGQALVC